MSDPSMLPGLGGLSGFSAKLPSSSSCQLLLGLGAPALMLNQFTSFMRQEPEAANEALASAERLHLISDDDLALRRVLNQGTALLHRSYREGAFHRAHDLLWATPGSLQSTDWIALIPHANAQTADGALSAQTVAQAKAEHRHNQAVTACAAELLPRYAGMALVQGSRVQDGALPPRIRIAHVWRRKDATLEDLVSQGGFIAGARVAGHRLRLTDLRLLLLRLGRLYQRLHELGMVYTDPKPANIALDLSLAASPGAASSRIGRIGRGMSLALQESLRILVGAGRPLPETSPIGRLCFIDAESLQPPGYADDDQRTAVTAMTPCWMSPLVLSALGTQHELKRIQSCEASDCFHVAAISFALITGQPPQARLMEERSHDPALLQEFTIASSTARFAQAALEVRVQRDFDTDARRLDYLVAERIIPQDLSRLVLAGLGGELQRLSEWTSRLHCGDWGEATA